MYGMFVLNKNNRNNLIFIFKNNIHSNFTNRIKDFNCIINFDKLVLDKIKKTIEEHYDKPYILFYENIASDLDLSKKIKSLNFSKQEIQNPLLQVSDIDLKIQKSIIFLGPTKK